MIGLDTSVLLRLLVGKPETQAKRAQEFLDQVFVEGQRAWVSDLVVSETYFALQYHYDVPKDIALKTLLELFEAGEIICIGAAHKVLKTPSLHSANPGFVDRLIHADYSRNDGTMATFEKKAARLERATVI